MKHLSGTKVLSKNLQKNKNTFCVYTFNNAFIIYAAHKSSTK